MERERAGQQVLTAMPARMAAATVQAERWRRCRDMYAAVLCGMPGAAHRDTGGYRLLGQGIGTRVKVIFAREVGDCRGAGRKCVPRQQGAGGMQTLTCALIRPERMGPSPGRVRRFTSGRRRCPAQVAALWKAGYRRAGMFGLFSQPKLKQPCHRTKGRRRTASAKPQRSLPIGRKPVMPERESRPGRWARRPDALQCRPLWAACACSDPAASDRGSNHPACGCFMLRPAMVPKAPIAAGNLCSPRLLLQQGNVAP